MIDLSKISDFDWDDGNARKNEKHGVSNAESEQIFYNQPLLLLADLGHSQTEPRFHALGKTDEGRTLHVTFTLRNLDRSIRIISARDMHRKERSIYEKAT